MSIRPIQDYRIAAGHDVALGSLINIETIKPSGDTKYFYSPQAIGNYDPGSPNVRGDGLFSFNGKPSTVWFLAAATRKQLAYARATWANGGWSGYVTIYTTTGDETYARYNANMLISFYNVMDGKYFANKGMQLTMTGLVGL